MKLRYTVAFVTDDMLQFLLNSTAYYMIVNDVTMVLLLIPELFGVCFKWELKYMEDVVADPCELPRGDKGKGNCAWGF